MIKRTFSVLLSFGTLFSAHACTEHASCPEGVKMFILIRSQLDKNNECTTPVDKLEEVSEEMKSLEEHAFVNEKIKLLYARYLCSQYSVKYGSNKDVDMNNQDITTLNYIKGLGLYGQLLSFRHKMVDCGSEFEKYLYRLNLDGKVLKKHKEELTNIVIEVGLYPQENVRLQSNNDSVDCLTPNKYFSDKIYKNRNEIGKNIINNMYLKLNRLNNYYITDAFLYDQYVWLEKNACLGMLLDAIKDLYNNKEGHFSEYMQWLCSISLRNKDTNFTKQLRLVRNNKFNEAEEKKNSSFLEHSADEKKYLFSCVKNNPIFKNRYIGYAIYHSMGECYVHYKEFYKSISYFESALNYRVESYTLCALSDVYFNLGKYQQALELFNQAKNLPNLEEDDNKYLKRKKHYYLDLLDKTGNIEKYKEELVKHNEKSIKNQLGKNKKWRAAAKKAQELNALKEKERLRREAEQKLVPALKKEVKQESSDSYDYSRSTESENLKKEYSGFSSIKKEKTRGVADPTYDVEAVAVIEDVKRPTVHLESLLSGNALKVGLSLFSCYDKSPIMDDKLRIFRRDIAMLIKGLGFSFSYAGGKGSHAKVTIEDEDDEYMIIIPEDGIDGVGAHYIKSLREAFLKLRLCPRDLEGVLRAKGLID